ncbi:MAG: PepSY-associated TM helix domain-containing protein [Comamonadaceae bacterium]|nr:PepSY-associated TM helix domain-containing protein [Comamonadaceae bacterium]
MSSSFSASSPSASAPPGDARRRARWLKTLHEWHWVSAALCLLGMVLFSVTGITLNHASQIEAKPQVMTRKATVPAPLLAPAQALGQAGGQGAKGGDTPPPLPAALQDWVRAELGVSVAGRAVEWSEDEAYVSLPRPGGDAWLRIDLASGALEYEHTDRGWISYLNDLHKGRHTGAAWRWFIDIFAVAALVFSITGLLIMKMHAANRPMTWPVTGLGVLIPLLLALLLMH